MAESGSGDSPGRATAGNPAVVRHAALLVVAALWATAVLGWPRLPAGGDAAALGRESAVLIAAASIDGGLVVLSLTVGLIALQLLSQLSWRLNRVIIDGSLVGMISAAVVSGVAWPLWVASAPSPVLARWAFASFGWSVLLIAAAAWLAAGRVQPAWLVDRACQRALRLVHQPASARPAAQVRLAAAAASLAELVGSDWLPYAQFRKAAVTYAGVLAAQCRAAAIGEVMSEVRDLAAHAQESSAGARAEAVILALSGLGIAQARCTEVHTAVCRALQGLAAYLRSSGSGDLAANALDALVDVTDARIEVLLPIARIAELEPPEGSATENGRAADVYFRGRSGPAAAGARLGRWWPTVSVRPDGFGVAFRGAPEPRRHELAWIAARFADGDAIERHELAVSLQALMTAPHPGPLADPGGEELRRRKDSGEAYDLLGSTVTGLAALLASPSPGSTGWPGGWQGQGELDRDVRRIAGLSAAAYLRGQYPPTSAAEEALEQIAAMIRHEPTRLSDVPADRTRWRDPPTAEEEGGPASATAASLGALMELAFRAGFDRRALLTGRRILAAATSSARAGDLHGLLAYRNAIQVFTAAAILHGPTSRTWAGRHRQRVVLAGMIAETDQLLEYQENPRLSDAVIDIANNLTWRAHGRDVFELRAELWQAQLAAAGWPVPLPGTVPPIDRYRDPAKQSPLPGYLLADAEETISYELGRDDPIWAASAITSLWAHGAVTAQSDPAEAKRIADLLARHVREHDARHRSLPFRSPAPGQDTPPGTRAMDPRLRRLATAAIRWCKAADPAASCVIPPAVKDVGTVQVAAARLVAGPGLIDWTYQGVHTTDDESLVIVREPDGSRRLLRDAEACARGRFAWGYGGNGPHALADALVLDILDDDAHCPACLGSSPCGAGLVTCPACGDSGERIGMEWAAGALVEKLISGLPQAKPWELTRRDMLTKIAQEQKLRARLRRLRRGSKQ